MSLLNSIKQLSEKYLEQVVSARRHLHQHPELSFQEFNTSAYVCTVLDAHHITYTKGIVKTGIVALIKGKNPTKKTILLRADLDALPIQEQNDVVYKSQNNGVMHACGHDVHTASVLGSAIILNDLKNEFEGTIKIMFQPGEEVLPGGASLMIKEGILQNPDIAAAIAQHVFPSMEVGKVGFRPNMYMASTDELHITITGKGGHAALPNEYINPLVIAATIIKEVEKCFARYVDAEGVSRSTKNDIPTIIAFGKIEGKGATNVIPETVYLAGTFRTMDEDWRVTVKKELANLIHTICENYLAHADVNIIEGYPCLINNTDITNICKTAAIAYLGKENVEDLPLRMTAEDFAYITQHVPSCFYRLGTGNKSKGITAGVHTPTFNIDEKALEISTGLMAYMALQLLED